jgi:hypothetical protein
MKKDKKKYIYVGMIIIFAGLGGFFLPEILKQSTLIGIIIGTMIATFIITALNPDLEKDMRKNLSKQTKIRLSKILFSGFRQKFLHPTRIHQYIGLMWSIIIFPVVIFYDNVNLISLALIPIAFMLFAGLDGYQMIRRNEYANKYGEVIQGFPSRFFGYFILLISWGACTLLILSQIFNW